MPERARSADWLRLSIPIAIALLFIFAAWKMGFFTRGSEEIMAKVERITGRRWLAPGFILVYAALCALALPVTMLAYFAGAVFGFAKGAVYIWVASMIGALAGYYLARHALGAPARKLVAPLEGKLRDLQRRASAKVIFRLQLAPLLAFGIVNYAAGIAHAPVWSFLIGTGLGIIPGTLLAAFVGDRFEAGLGEGNHTALWIAVGISVLLLAISFVPLGRKSRRGREASEPAPPPTATCEEIG